jgi:DNA modification methylase
MTPYYEQDGITIYHAEAMDVLGAYMDTRQVGRAFDLLLTDPPYGLGQGHKKKRGGSGAKAHKTGMFAGLSRDWTDRYGDSEWDDVLAHEPLAAARTISRDQIIFGGNYYDLPPATCWLVWDKDNHDTDFADCELAWTNLKKAVRKITYRWNGMLQQPGRPKEKRVHPTQKPEAVMVWALQHAQNAQTVLDPFMGSGTTLVAAKRLGKAATGIEREERYCELAAERLSQGALPMEFSA